MRVAVDARTVYSPVRRGTGKNLIDLYRRIARLHPDWEFLMFHRQERLTDNPLTAEANVVPKAIEIQGDRWNLWEQVRLPLAARLANAAVLHSPANTAPRVPLVPLVMTVHDLLPLDTFPDAPESNAWAANVARGTRIARRIITPSAYTKGRIVVRFDVAPEKIVVNHWAPDGTCRRVEDPIVIDEARRRYGLRSGQQYVFGFGAADPRKNTRRIIEAWATLAPSVRARLALLLVGIHEPFLTAVRDLARALVPEGGWSLMPFAEEADLPALMSGATALCYPSLGEGFGLPVLDGFACGTPVITSNSTSLPEVAGDAALLVDPTDVAALGKALERVATDVELCNDLRARGFERLRAFSWERCAETAAAVLSEAA